MKTPIYIFLLLLAGCASSGISSVTYRGEEIQLSRTYSDLDEYEDDENNLPAEQLPRVAALVRSAPVAASYASHEATFEAVSKLMFPGYGFSALNLGQPIALFALEVPQANEERFLVFEQRGSSWVLVEDFLWPDASGSINSAIRKGGRIYYLDHKSRVVREQSL